MPEATWNEAQKAKTSNVLESTDCSFHRSVHSYREDPCGHRFPGFVGGLFLQQQGKDSEECVRSDIEVERPGFTLKEKTFQIIFLLWVSVPEGILSALFVFC